MTEITMNASKQIIPNIYFDEAKCWKPVDSSFYQQTNALIINLIIYPINFKIIF